MDFFSHYGGDDDIEGDSSVVSISTHKEEEPEAFGLVGYGYDYKEVCFFLFFLSQVLFLPSIGNILVIMII